MSRTVKKSGSFLPQYEGFRPGQDKYQIFLKIKQPTQEDKFSYSNIKILDSQNILVNAQQEKKLSKKEQKEKVFTFDRVFHQRITNEEYYRDTFPGLVTKFLSGINQTILVIGPNRSGKTQTTIGTVRDPGILLYFFQDLFNFIEDNFFEDHVTIKLSIFEHHPKRGFRDLLVDPSYEFQPHQLPNGENQLLGIPEIIIDNFLLAMKIVRIALVNLQNLEQNIDSDTFQQKIRETSLIFEIKAEIAPTEDIREQVIVAKTRFVKTMNDVVEEGQKKDEGSLTFCLTNIMKLLGEASLQKSRKITHLSFRQFMLLDYLRVGLTNFSSVTLLCCINQDYNDTLRIANLASSVLCSKQISQFSIYQWNQQLKELIENQKDALGLFSKEFYNSEEKKLVRGKIIFNIMNDLQSYFNLTIDILDAQGQLMYSLNCLYSQVLSYHCQKYSSIITTEDVKEFYLAKIEIYAIDQLKNYQDQLLVFIKQNLGELYVKNSELKQCKSEITTYLKNLNIISYPGLTNFDIQRIVNTTKLSQKLMNLFTQTSAQNIFNNKEARETVLYLFQEINKIGEKYLDIMDDLNDQTKEEFSSNQPLINSIIGRTSPRNNKESTIIMSEPMIKSYEANYTRQAQLKNIRTRTSLYDNDSDLISRLFKDKNTRNYKHEELFQTQPIIRSELSPTLLMKKQQSQEQHNSPKTSFNFFQELKIKQSLSNDVKVNPNRIHQMVREWQEKRHMKSTGISFMKQSYSNFQEIQQIKQQEEYVSKLPKLQTIIALEYLQPIEQKLSPYSITTDQFKYSIISTNNNQTRFSNLNLKEQQFKKFNIQ